MKIETRFNIGEPVKVYSNDIENGKITDKIGCAYGHIIEIIIRIDKISGQPYVMYRFSNNNCLYSEKSLMRANF